MATAEVQKSILLVEDDAIVAMSEKTALEEYGYAVCTVNSGEKAIQAFKEASTFDLVLMDINLGQGLDGTETAKLILMDQDIPIVFLSSHTGPETVEKTEKITSYGYVVKNSSITVLDASIKMVFKLFGAKKQMAQAAEQFRAIVENTSDCIVRYNREVRPVYGNPSILTALGISLEQFVGKSHRELGFPENWCLLWDTAIGGVFQTGIPTTIESEVVLARGELIKKPFDLYI